MRWFDIPDELLPPVYRKIKDMYAYARSLDSELREFRVYMSRILDNFFIQTCDLETIEYWEKLLGIVLFGHETIEERRQNILRYLNNNSPTTEPYVRDVLTEAFGENGYKLWFDVENGHPFDLFIEIYNGSVDAIKSFMYWMYRMCPAHILLNAGQIDTPDTHFAIYGHGESDYSATATMTMSTGTTTLYYGETAVTVDTLEL